MTEPGSGRVRDPLVPWLVAAAALTRLLAATASPLLNADGYFYLETAAFLREGRWAEGLRARDLHPLYPALVAFGGFLADPRAAATFLSIAAGAAALLPLHALAEAGWGRRAARFTAFLWAVHPIYSGFHGRVLTEAVYHLTGLLAVSALWRGLFRRSLPWSLAGGAGLGLAYLARSEGIILAGACGLAAAAALLRLPELRRHWPQLAAAALAAVAVGLPYAAWISADAGALVASPRVSFDRLSGPVGDAGEPSRAPVGILLRCLNGALKTAYLPVAALGLLGLAAARRSAAPGAGALREAIAVLSAAYFAVVAAYAVRRGGYFGPRYLSLPVALLLPWAGAGVDVALGWLERRRAAPAWAAGLLLGLAGLLTAKTLDVRRGDDLPLLEAARWVRDHGGRGTGVASSNDYAAYHAEARFLGGSDAQALLRRLRAGEIRFLIWREIDLGMFPPETWDEIRAVPGVGPARRFGTPGKGAVIYPVERP